MDTIPQLFHVFMQEHCAYKYYNVHFVSLHIFNMYQRYMSTFFKAGIE